MKRKLILLFFAWCSVVATAYAQVERRVVGNLELENVPDIPDTIREHMMQYQSVRSVGFNDWLPDGSGMLISTRLGETSQLHKIMGAGMARQQLTFYSEPVSSARMSPDKTHHGFLFNKDVGGSEFYQILYFDMNTGKATLLTDGKSRHSRAQWSHKGDRFVYTSTQRNGRDNDIYINTLNGTAKVVFEGKGAWGVYAWSPDDTKLLIGNYVSANESFMHVLDLKTGQTVAINEGRKMIRYGSAVWAGNGTGIYYASDEDSEHTQLRYYDLSSKKTKSLTPGLNWGISDIELSKDGKQMVFTTNEEGMTALYNFNQTTGSYTKVKGLPIGVVYGVEFSPVDYRISLVINTPQTPGDLYVMNLTDESLERWTFSEVGGLNSDRFVKPTIVRYPTFDKEGKNQRTIPAFVYKPENGTKKHPVLIDIHGGPEGQERPTFSSLTQYFVNEMGIAVITPNVRGSSGYGKSYLMLDNGYLRENSVKDIGALLDWIATQPDLDASRVCVYGGSYGGYMVLASMIHYNTRLRCGIDVVGISNFVTFLKNTQEYRRDLRRVEYGDERDPAMNEFLQRISPTTQAQKITKPLYVAQGYNDPRVPYTEAEQIVKTVRENKGEVWYFLAKDEGHGFSKKTNRDYFNQSTVLFLHKYLLN